MPLRAKMLPVRRIQTCLRHRWPLGSYPFNLRNDGLEHRPSRRSCATLHNESLQTKDQPTPAILSNIRKSSSFSLGIPGAFPGRRSEHYFALLPRLLRKQFSYAVHDHHPSKRDRQNRLFTPKRRRDLDFHLELAFPSETLPIRPIGFVPGSRPAGQIFPPTSAPP
jgi:hypothetical protein